MGDVENNSFIAPYPPEDVYGLGVAGPSSTKSPEPKSTEKSVNNNEVQQREEVENTESKESNTNPEVQPEISGGGNGSLEDHLGNNIDTKV